MTAVRVTASLRTELLRTSDAVPNASLATVPAHLAHRLRALPPVGSYTAQIESADGRTGAALVELYDAGGADSRLVNLSTRGAVAAGAPLTIGLVVGAGGPRWFLFRGIGASLAAFGLGAGLADPVLTVFQGGRQIAQNDDWSLSYWATEVERANAAAGAFALGVNAPDAALLVQLPSGSYTFQISGKGSASGTVLGEAYELP